MAVSRPAQTPPVSCDDAVELLVVQPDPACDLDRFECWLIDAGARLRIIRPFDGEQLPHAVEEDGLLVMGGAVSSNDDAHLPWLEEIRSLYRQAQKAGKPSLGICLGSQLLAQAFGGQVTPGRNGLEAGPIYLSCREEAGDDPLLSGIPNPFPAVSFHFDEIESLPPDAEWLVNGAHYPYQAFCIGSAWGVQFHPEVTPTRLRSWNKIAVDRDPSMAQELEDRAREFDQLDDSISTAMKDLADNFIDLVRNRPDPTDPPIRLTIVQPDVDGPPERLGKWLNEPNLDISLIRPFLGEEVPQQLDADGLVVLGGGMNAYADEDHPWLEDIRQLYRSAAIMDAPVLGICLGAQLLATTFGGEVEVGAAAGPEMGVVPVEWADAGREDALTSGLPQRFQSAAHHFDGIRQLPPRAIRLGAGEKYPNQVFRIGAAVGVQFHPESSPELFRMWANKTAAEQPGMTEELDARYTEFLNLDLEIFHGTRSLVRNFIGIVRTHVRSTRGQHTRM